MAIRKPSIAQSGVATLVLLATLSSPLIAKAKSIFTLGVTNPTQSAADSMRAIFNATVSQAINPNGNVAQPSDVFLAASGLTTGGDITFSEGSLGFQSTVKSSITLDANFQNLGNEAVRGIDLFSNGGVIANFAARTKNFQQFVLKFTNDEFYDFSNPQSGILNLINPSTDASNGIQYSILNLRVYKNLPLSNFNAAQVLDGLGSLVPVFSQSELTLAPGGGSSPINLGQIASGTYAVAVADSVATRDLSNGSMNRFSGPLFYAQDFQGVPVSEPDTLAILAAGVAFLLSFRSQRYLRRSN
jgi:hypothetical protein